MNRKQRRAQRGPRGERIEWRRAPDFAEVAEALKIATTQIMALRNPQSDSVLALYTQEQDSKLLYSAQLKRGVDGVLFVASQPEAHPGMWDQIVAHVESGLDDRFAGDA